MKPRFSLNRARIAFLHDLAMAAASFPVALYLRTGRDFSYYAADHLWETIAAFTVVAGLVFRYSRMYRGVWRYASIDDLLAITKAVTLAVLVFLPVLFFATRMEFLPRSVPIIQWFVLLGLLGGPRFVYRIFKDRRMDRIMTSLGHRRIPVLLIGAGDEAELYVRDLKRDPNAAFRAVGIVDAKGGRIGREIHGVPVTGPLEALDDLLDSDAFPEPPEKIVFTKERHDGATVRRVLEIAEAHGLTVARLPRLSEFKSGNGPEEAPTIRPIAVEDLLGRPQTPLDRPAIEAMVRGRRVMVTGAGGTIGAELARQIAALGPAHLTLLDNSEYQLYQIDQELGAAAAGQPRDCVLGDVRDRDRVLSAFAASRPELVFHAAALKHVPMVEANPMEGILTNTVGSRIVADACRQAGVRCMVQISTDKAVNPTNVMGATKRLAEAYVQALDLSGEVDTRYVAVRFGNVLGSTGSVVPLFQKQLAAGGPLTVTHPDMTRYFMTVREAVELVLQAATTALDETAETKGKLFVLDMGEPVRILELAQQMIRLAGLTPEKDVAIAFTGPRPGEKLSEELFHNGEELVASSAQGLFLAAPRVSDAGVLSAALDRLETVARKRDRAGALRRLGELVPEYRPEAAVGASIAPAAADAGRLRAADG